MGSRVVMHIDLDAFFASCEEVRRPGLKGKPVIVGADPKQGKGRGVVSTANYVARQYGIQSAMPISEAYQRCKHGAFIPPKYSYYKQISERIFALIAKLGYPFEQVGIDEAYMELSVLPFRQAKRVGQAIRRIVCEKEKITCSVGIAPNKLLAKIASDFEKPDGLTIVEKNEVANFLAPLPIRKIPGIGPKTAMKLHDLGIHTVGNISHFAEQELLSTFGKSWGSRLFRVAQGKDERKVGTIHERKSIGAERTFMFDVSQKNIIYEKLYALIESVFLKMRERGFTSRVLVLKIRYEDFETHTVQRKNLQEFSSVAEAIAVATFLLTPFLKRNKKIRLVGARFAQLESKKRSFVQLCL